MDTLDGFILNLLVTERPVLTREDFESENAWVCNFLEQDLDLAKEFIKYRLERCGNRSDKLEFLYEAKSCFKYTIQFISAKLNPDLQGERRGGQSADKLRKRLSLYTMALQMADQAICYYIDCTKIKCENESSFALSDKKGSRIDLIRILNAMHELRLVTLKNGQYPSKEQFMKEAGKFFGVDLSKYDVDLSQALNNTKVEANLKVFEEMKNITQNQAFAK